jgi:hypothetical protein
MLSESQRGTAVGPVLGANDDDWRIRISTSPDDKKFRAQNKSRAIRKDERRLHK